MALPADGPISFSQIANEFGLPPGRNLGAYRISKNVGTLGNLPLDTGIPTLGTIGFNHFRGKRLNIVVDLYNIPQDSTRRNARNRYNNNFVTVIGEFRTRPNNSSGTKVYINVNQRIGSDKGSRNNVALRTGSWDSDTQLITVVGPNGGLYGAGGDGGAGAGDNNGGNGGNGSSALGIDYSSTVITQSGAVIRSGRGGGGGGGSGSGVDFSNIQSCNGRNNNSPIIGGGGGSGGSGIPAGVGGSASRYISRLSNKQGGATTFAGNGTNGTATANGQGGSGGVATPQDFPRCGTTPAFSGAGGGAAASGQSGNKPYRGAGGGGQSGYAIIVASGATLSGSPTVDGDILNSGTIT
jgi:hypothetical protein